MSGPVSGRRSSDAANCVNGPSPDVDVDMFIKPLTFVPLHRGLELQVLLAFEAQAAERPSYRRKESAVQAGDVAEMQALVPDINSLLQFLRTKRTPERLSRLSDNGRASGERNAG